MPPTSLGSARSPSHRISGTWSAARRSQLAAPYRFPRNGCRRSEAKLFSHDVAPRVSHYTNVCSSSLALAPILLLLAIAWGNMTAAALILALYLAVIFQTFGNRANGNRRTPFNLGLRFPDAEASRWKNPALVIGCQVFALGGAALAVLDTAQPLVVASVAYLGVLVGMPQSLWALQMAFPKWTQERASGVLNIAFAAPLVAATVAGAVAVVV